MLVLFLRVFHLDRFDDRQVITLQKLTIGPFFTCVLSVSQCQLYLTRYHNLPSTWFECGCQKAGRTSLRSVRFGDEVNFLDWKYGGDKAKTRHSRHLGLKVRLRRADNILAFEYKTRIIRSISKLNTSKPYDE